MSELLMLLEPLQSFLSFKLHVYVPPLPLTSRPFTGCGGLQFANNFKCVHRESKVLSTDSSMESQRKFATATYDIFFKFGLHYIQLMSRHIWSEIKFSFPLFFFFLAWFSLNLDGVRAKLVITEVDVIMERLSNRDSLSKE